ncbi:MAG: response regulator [Nitrospira sp. CG24C]|jgi:CheY-like chemotaxis protein|nr:MAG: response regulator [Nitrospira sp. CG24C]
MTKIVVADDDRMFRKAAETTLRRQGYAVTTASDGEEALQLIRSELPDIIVLDLIMPKLQGFDVLQALKQNSATAAIPVIVLSSLTQEQDKQEALDLGAVAYFNKATYSLGKLVKQVEHTLTKGQESCQS